VEKLQPASATGRRRSTPSRAKAATYQLLLLLLLQVQVQRQTDGVRCPRTTNHSKAAVSKPTNGGCEPRWGVSANSIPSVTCLQTVDTFRVSLLVKRFCI